MGGENMVDAVGRVKHPTAGIFRLKTALLLFYCANV
jgi:hypothetical protein